jgi:hypothetical protein
MLILAELGDLPVQVEGELLSGKSTRDGRHGDLRTGEAIRLSCER